MITTLQGETDIQKKSIKVALIISFALHLGVVVVKWQPEIMATAKDVREKITRIKLVDPVKDTQEQLVKTKPIKTERQIVTTEKSELDLKPVPTRFLSENDQVVDRQTTTKKIGSFKEAGKGQKVGSEIVKQKTAKATNVAKKAKVSLSALGQIKIPKSVAPTKEETNLASLGLQNGREGVAGFARNNDYIEDIPLGDMTKLNTVEYKYYGFYHRIKQRLEQHWGRTLQEKAQTIVKRGGRVPASADKITALSITLNSLGQIIDIELRSSSGVTEFDDAAVESFNKAGPFPNPPKGMIKNGMAKIEWGFVVKS
tara:strand:- start:62 stop:1000 length:939 start_codon:yes stop_codon:yes gene_type:complete